MSTTNLGILRDSGRPLTFLHSSDLHLGASDHVQVAYDQLVRTALEREVDLVLLGGDVYDVAERSANLQKRFVDVLRKLDTAGVHVFIAHGNHDPVAGDFRPVVGAMPKRVHVFDSGEPQTFLMQLAGSQVAVTGVSFANKHDRENLAAKIASTTVDADLRIAVMHGNLEGQTGHDPYAPCTEADLSESLIDYWALGHIHIRNCKQMAPGRWWAYPGNLQGRSTKPAECGEKGALLVRAEGGGFAEPEFVACDVHRFLRVEVDVDGLEHYDDAVNNVIDALASIFDEHDRRSLTVRLAIVGQTPVHEQLREMSVDVLTGLIDNDKIEIARVELNTSQPIDRRLLAQGDDLVGVLLRRLDKLRTSGDHEEVNTLFVKTKEFAGDKALKRITKMIELGQLDSDVVLAKAEKLVLDKLAVN